MHFPFQPKATAWTEFYVRRLTAWRHESTWKSISLCFSPANNGVQHQEAASTLVGYCTRRYKPTPVRKNFDPEQKRENVAARSQSRSLIVSL